MMKEWDIPTLFDFEISLDPQNSVHGKSFIPIGNFSSLGKSLRSEEISWVKVNILGFGKYLGLWEISWVLGNLFVVGSEIYNL